jgi:hypothetical protein
MRHTPDERRVAYTLVAVQALVCSLAVLDVWLAYGA